jgi:hypothetical protein
MSVFSGQGEGKMKKLVLLTMVAVLCTSALHAVLIEGYLNTPVGMYSGDDGWAHSEGGYRVTWTITQSGSVWHYEYAFSKADGSALDKETSHFIIELSDNILDGDLYEFTGDIDPEEPTEFGTFVPGAGNPGFPTGESIFGIKINMGGDQTVVGFDSTRAPMWGDFYAKDGVTQVEGEPVWNFAYNTSIGATVANPNAYGDTPVDGGGNALYKILVPDTIPEPATMALLALGGLLIRKRK